MPVSRRRRKRSRAGPARKGSKGLSPLLVTAVLTGLGAAAVLAGTYIFRQIDDGAEVAVVVPALSEPARAGRAAFARHCAQCHGESAQGTHQGPPLIHRVYEPSHHGDGAFRRAIASGVRQHHWSFGDMPAQRQVSREEAVAIVRFVREVQRANAIY